WMVVLGRTVRRLAAVTSARDLRRTKHGWLVLLHRHSHTCCSSFRRIARYPLGDPHRRLYDLAVTADHRRRQYLVLARDGATLDLRLRAAALLALTPSAKPRLRTQAHRADTSAATPDRSPASPR